jgi:NitT/TauT family transport system substrate-binding protein
MLKMMEGFLKRDEIKWTNAGTHKERLAALRAGNVKAVSLQEPWISVAEAQGARVIIESRSTRSEAAGDELDGPTLAKMFNAQARAAEAIDKNPAKYAHYLLDEAGGAIELRDLKLSRMLNAPPAPYTRERFDDNYQWTLSWGLVPPGATYENTVDNRAWR